MAKVLIVEDSKLISNAVKLILEHEGIDTMETSDGSKVPEIVKKSKVDLVILDLMMPGVSGEEVLQMLKTDAATSKTKVMILTARVEAIRHNPKLKECDKFMTKPFDMADLVKEVKKLI